MAHKMLLTELPDEILSMIVQAADRDLKTLSSLSLVCRALLPVVREHMFTMVNARALEEACMRPYLVHITELQIGKPDIAAYARDTADCRFIPPAELLRATQAQIFAHHKQIHMVLRGCTPSALRDNANSHVSNGTHLVLQGVLCRPPAPPDHGLRPPKPRAAFIRLHIV